MMGSNDKPQSELFYSFNLDDVVPEDHLLRQIDQFLDFSELREHLAPYYSHTGRPSIDPELMIRMLLIGYCLGIRSERQLCMEVQLNLAYRWFCKLSISDPVPDHSTFSKNRHGRFRESEGSFRGCSGHSATLRGMLMETTLGNVRFLAHSVPTAAAERPILWQFRSATTRRYSLNSK